jgi:hypothetical protein
MKATRSASFSTASTRCSTRTTPRPGLQVQHRLADQVIIDGCSPSVGSSRSSTFGFQAQRAGDGQHLLLAPRKRLRDTWVKPFAQAGKRSAHARAASCRVIAGHQTADFKIFGHSQRSEQAAALRHIGRGRGAAPDALAGLAARPVQP